MKQLYFTLLGVLMVVVAYFPAQAQSDAAPDSAAQTTVKPASPYHVKAQFAGGIGLVSAGFGRRFFKDKLETDLFVGYLPESVGDDRIITSAIKVTYVPIRPIKVKAVEWQPVRLGAQISYTFGDDYFAVPPNEKYTNGYYTFSTAFHGSILGGGQLDLARVPKLNRFSAYYEFSSSLEYLISYIQNPEYLGPGKIFKLALGLRMRL